jgi:beta-phosphoglucomutase-like phosphatase (HAD superfamily)
VGHVALDFDGTLVDTQPTHLAAWRDVLREFGINKVVTHEDINGISIEKFLLWLGVDSSTGKRLAERKAERFIELGTRNPLRVFDGVLPFLAMLRSRPDTQTSIVTSCEIPILESCMSQKLLPFDMFAHIITTNHFKKAKPDPEPYLLCAEYHGCKAKDILAVEDSLSGVMSANNAGCIVAAVTNTAPQAKLEPYASLTIRRIDELTAHLCA